VQAKVVDVSPVLNGWVIKTTLTQAVLIFRSGGMAERSARALGRCAAQAGYDAEVRVHDRAGRLVGTTLYPAAFLETSPPLAAQEHDRSTFEGGWGALRSPARAALDGES
jgi:hypothetical protein